jgi:putative peptide zinc metalloprotease protein
LLRAEHQTILYAAEPGRLTKLSHDGDRIEQGEAVFALQAPSLTFHRATAAAILAGVEARMKGVSFDPEQASTVEVGYQELQGAVAELAQIDAEEAQLIVRAPFSGVVTDIPPSLRLDEWLPRREALGMLIDPSHQIVEAYIAEADLARVHPGAEATFYPENGDPSVRLKVSSVSAAPVRTLDALDMASVYGGGVAVRKDSTGKLVPETAIYHALLTPFDPGKPISAAQWRLLPIAPACWSESIIARLRYSSARAVSDDPFWRHLAQISRFCRFQALCSLLRGIA